ncbi:MAG: hypothetical protein LBS99_00700 [Clostridiales bacterium]|jgi:hypothetical protein|nr:hypothetical protein [Clostridiales bacterium]
MAIRIVKGDITHDGKAFELSGKLYESIEKYIGENFVVEDTAASSRSARYRDRGLNPVSALVTLA